MPLHKHPIGRALVASVMLTLGVISAVVSVSLVAQPVAAQFGLKETLGGIKEKPATYADSNTALPELIGKIIQTALSLVGTLFLVLMIYGGFTWMTARGDTKNLQKAKDLISSAIVGLIIVASAYAITTFLITRIGSEREVPGTGSEDVDECATASQTCTTHSECVIPGNYCYVGTCACDAAATGDGTAANPCSSGSCVKR